MQTINNFNHTQFAAQSSYIFIHSSKIFEQLQQQLNKKLKYQVGHVHMMGLLPPLMDRWYDDDKVLLVPVHRHSLHFFGGFVIDARGMMHIILKELYEYYRMLHSDIRCETFSCSLLRTAAPDGTLYRVPVWCFFVPKKEKRDLLGDDNYKIISFKSLEVKAEWQNTKRLPLGVTLNLR